MGEHNSAEFQKAPAEVCMGASVILYGYDDLEKTTVVIFIEVGDRYVEKGQSGYGLPGGRAENPEETALEVAARELNEELQDEHQKPLLIISPRRLRIVDTAIEYNLPHFDPQRRGVTGHVFQYELSSQEIQKLKKFSARLLRDVNHQQDIHENSNREVWHIHIVPIDSAHLYTKHFCYSAIGDIVRDFVEEHQQRGRG